MATRARGTPYCVQLPPGGGRMTDKAQTFARLHAGSDLLILPNAWDAGSACVVENAGAKAIATSSAAVAWAHGFPDGELLAPEALLATVRAIARVVDIP